MIVSVMKMGTISFDDSARFPTKFRVHRTPANCCVTTAKMKSSPVRYFSDLILVLNITEFYRLIASVEYIAPLKLAPLGICAYSARLKSAIWLIFR